MSSSPTADDILAVAALLEEQRRRQVENERTWREKVRRAAEFSEAQLFNRRFQDAAPAAFQEGPPVLVTYSDNTNV